MKTQIGKNKGVILSEKSMLILLYSLSLILSKFVVLNRMFNICFYNRSVPVIILLSKGYQLQFFNQTLIGLAEVAFSIMEAPPSL